MKKGRTTVTTQRGKKVRVALIGVGNCASSFVQGLHYYRDTKEADAVPGLMHVNLGGYHIRDVEISAAFDVVDTKVGLDVAEAIYAYPNNTYKFADVPKMGVKVERGELLAWDDFWRHARSLGGDEGRARNYYAGNQAIRLTVKGKRYFVGAAHFQFTARKAALQAVLPIPAEWPMGRVRLLDEAMNAAGYLRLCTEKWYVQHLGNVLPQPSDFVVAPSEMPMASKRQGRAGGIWRWGPLRKILQWIYGWSFNRLHRSQ